MDKVAIYLRKSRADLEAEARGEGETLAKHRKALLKFARENNLNIIQIREEIVSGEKIVHRPEMIELLKEVEQGLYDAVLCMDIDRLGRGNMQEQGLILETFKAAQTRIITPRKVYDLNDEFDEEYSEFEAFMARKELKIITRRLQGGRKRSAEDGNYLGTNAPYGYKIGYQDKNRILVPHPDQAPVVQIIFDLYVNRQYGASKIANHLNSLGHKTNTGKRWHSSSILFMLRNPVYIGRIQWKKHHGSKEQVDVKGKHEPIIDQNTFDKAQEILKSKYHVPYQLLTSISNPLAGIVRCSKCGTSMVYRPYTRQKPHLICHNTNCDNKSSKFEYVENKLLEILEEQLNNIKNQMDIYKPKEDVNSILSAQITSLRAKEKELSDLNKQKNNLHDLLEQGVYDIDTYLERSQNLAERIEICKNTVKHLQQSVQSEEKREHTRSRIIPQLEHVLDLYPKTDDPAIKNDLLKSVIEQAVYTKEKHQIKDDFWLEVKLKM